MVSPTDHSCLKQPLLDELEGKEIEKEGETEEKKRERFSQEALNILRDACPEPMEGFFPSAVHLNDQWQAALDVQNRDLLKLFHQISKHVPLSFQKEVEEKKKVEQKANLIRIWMREQSTTLLKDVELSLHAWSPCDIPEELFFLEKMHKKALQQLAKVDFFFPLLQFLKHHKEHSFASSLVLKALLTVNSLKLFKELIQSNFPIISSHADLLFQEFVHMGWLQYIQFMSEDDKLQEHISLSAREAALYEAVQYRHTKIVIYLLEKTNPSSLLLETCLLDFASEGREEIRQQIQNTIKSRGEL